MNTEEGGAIDKKKLRVRFKKKDEKVEEAIEKKAQGGAIDKKKLRVKPKKKDKKIEEAIEKKAQGGRMKFHDPIHKHLHANLSGRGGRVDPPYVRKKMHELTQGFHPSVFQSYMKGKFHDLPQDSSFHPRAPVKRNTPYIRPHVIDTGGSLSAIHHSVDGVLTSVDSTFYSHLTNR